MYTKLEISLAAQSHADGQGPVIEIAKASDLDACKAQMLP